MATLLTPTITKTQARAAIKRIASLKEFAAAHNLGWRTLFPIRGDRTYSPTPATLAKIEQALASAGLLPRSRK